MIAAVISVLFGRGAERRYDERAAERRWRARNHEKREAGCQCGAPATHVEYDHRNVGSVPVEFWTCAAHVGVTSWSRVGDGPWVPSWPQPQRCADCPGGCSSLTRIGEDQPYEWHCPRRATPTGT